MSRDQSREPVPIDLTIEIVDVVSGQPIIGAKISYNAQNQASQTHTVFTNNQGLVDLTLYASAYWFHVESSGYHPNAAIFTLTPTRIYPLKISLTPK
jgi:hypothetical protein